MQFYICLNLYHQDWTLRLTMDFEWQWCVNVGSPIVTNVLSGGGCWGWGKYVCFRREGICKLPVLSIQFCCESKTALKKIKSIKKQNQTNPNRGFDWLDELRSCVSLWSTECGQDSERAGWWGSGTCPSLQWNQPSKSRWDGGGER